MLDILRDQFHHLVQYDMRLAGELPEWPIYLFILLAVLIATTVHEFGHAWMADRLGDEGPRAEGRVTLNPAAHLDPLGSLLLLVTLWIGFPLGWGRPVQTNPAAYRIGIRWGSLLVAAAGPLMNLLTAIVLAPIARFVLGGGLGYSEAAFWTLIGLLITMLINLSLFCFNLVPIYPLDGSHVAAALLPEPLSRPYRRFMKQFGAYVLIGLLWSGLLGRLLAPLIIGLFLFLIGQ